MDTAVFGVSVLSIECSMNNGALSQSLQRPEPCSPRAKLNKGFPTSAKKKLLIWRVGFFYNKFQKNEINLVNIVESCFCSKQIISLQRLLKVNSPPKKPL